MNRGKFKNPEWNRCEWTIIIGSSNNYFSDQITTQVICVLRIKSRFMSPLGSIKSANLRLVRPAQFPKKYKEFAKLRNTLYQKTCIDFASEKENSPSLIKENCQDLTLERQFIWKPPEQPCILQHVWSDSIQC